uniref:TRAF interacting protein with forkhead associated domain n=1 Tax=Coturnix japonica TaxID=93934 RepID=A0A8C2T2P6_COTJA
MTSFEEDETEETATCLHMTFYHPCQQDKMMFRCLNFCKREQVRADETAKFGRDSNVCHYNLVDTRVSRIQFSLQFYRKLNKLTKMLSASFLPILSLPAAHLLYSLTILLSVEFFSYCYS